MTWSLYILRCGDGSLYCGISTCVERRVAAHNAGRGARYTRARGPCSLLAAWRCGSQGDALRMERAFKRLRRDAKLSAARTNVLPASVLASTNKGRP